MRGQPGSGEGAANWGSWHPRGGKPRSDSRDLDAGYSSSTVAGPITGAQVGGSCTSSEGEHSRLGDHLN